MPFLPDTEFKFRKIIKKKRPFTPELVNRALIELKKHPRNKVVSHREIPAVMKFFGVEKKPVKEMLEGIKDIKFMQSTRNLIPPLHSEFWSNMHSDTAKTVILKPSKILKPNLAKSLEYIDPEYHGSIGFMEISTDFFTGEDEEPFSAYQILEMQSSFPFRNLIDLAEKGKVKLEPGDRKILEDWYKLMFLFAIHDAAKAGISHVILWQPQTRIADRPEIKGIYVDTPRQFGFVPAKVKDKGGIVREVMKLDVSGFKGMNWKKIALKLAENLRAKKSAP